MADVGLNYHANSCQNQGLAQYSRLPDLGGYTAIRAEAKIATQKLGSSVV